MEPHCISENKDFAVNRTRGYPCDILVEDLCMLIRRAEETLGVAKELSTAEANPMLHWDDRKSFPLGQSTEVYTVASKWASLRVRGTWQCKSHPCSTGFECMQGSYMV